MRKKCFLLSCVSLFVAMTILSGCGTTNKFVYPYKSSNLIEVASQPKYDLKVAVLPFTEERGNRNISSSMWLYLIPVLSIGKLSYERPEAATMFLTIHDFEFDVSEDLAKAAVTSLKKSNLFQNVYFSYGGDIDNADFILTGDIVSTYYEGKVFSYGTSVFCPYLWLVGLPCGDSTNHLQINLTLSKIMRTIGNIVIMVRIPFNKAFIIIPVTMV